MNNKPTVEKQSLLNEIESLVRLSNGRGLSIGSLFTDLGGRGHALICLILCVPFLVPIPLPGLSTPFGVLLMIIGVALLFGIQPWIPKRLKRVLIPHSTLLMIENRSRPVLKRLERFIKPRGVMWTTGRLGQILHGGIIFVAASFLAIPAPPGGNVTPAVAIISASVALLEEDVLFTAVALIALVGTFIYFATLGVTLIKVWQSFSIG